jgi:hypothetical protein
MRSYGEAAFPLATSGALLGRLVHIIQRLPPVLLEGQRPSETGNLASKAR